MNDKFARLPKVGNCEVRCPVCQGEPFGEVGYLDEDKHAAGCDACVVEVDSALVARDGVGRCPVCGEDFTRWDVPVFVRRFYDEVLGCEECWERCEVWQL